MEVNRAFLIAAWSKVSILDFAAQAKLFFTNLFLYQMRHSKAACGIALRYNSARGDTLFAFIIPPNNDILRWERTFLVIPELPLEKRLAT